MLVLLTGPPGTGKSTLAEVAAAELGAAVLGWDWAMAGLRPFPEMQSALGSLDVDGHRRVGWSILGSLALAQLRAGRSVVLDGAGRTEAVAGARRLAAEAGVPSRVVVTACGDIDVHQQRIDGRCRDIPGWYELTWDDVARFLEGWTEPPGADLRLDAVEPLRDNVERLREMLSP